MSNFKTHVLVRQAVIAALYFVLTVTLGSFGYGPIQFRYAEVLNFLAFFSPFNAIGVTLGVFLSNLASPFGMVDVIFGTLHTIVSLIFIARSKNLFIASLWPTVFSFIIGYELAVILKLDGGFIYTTLMVMLSEFIIMTVIGYPLFKGLSKNKRFIEML